MTDTAASPKTGSEDAAIQCDIKQDEEEEAKAAHAVLIRNMKRQHVFKALERVMTLDEHDALKITHVRVQWFVVDGSDSIVQDIPLPDGDVFTERRAYGNVWRSPPLKPDALDDGRRLRNPDIDADVS
jgi:hypothetical protein